MCTFKAAGRRRQNSGADKNAAQAKRKAAWRRRRQGQRLPGGASKISVRANQAKASKLGAMTHILSAVAWPYANGPRHIGHVAGFGVPSDVFSRYMRMAGYDVLMVSGTDEHGTPILVAADEAGVSAHSMEADR